jgi:REP element-mobilizing transposase RayT
MARQNRGTVHAGVYHVWRRTAGSIPMFRDDDDRTDFCNRLARTIEKCEWVCFAFVLMPTHFHLILSLEEDALQPGMHWLFGTYAQQFNRRWSRSGHLRAGPYKARLVRNERDLQGVVRYIARNPVRARLCELPQDWYWSSYPASAGLAKPFPFVDDSLVLATIHDDVTRAKQLLRVIVEPR